MKAVLWITTLVFGSLFGLSIGLLCGAIFGLGLTIGWDARTAPQGASTNAALAAETVQPVDVRVSAKFETAAEH
jgi:hypothetical protein